MVKPRPNLRGHHRIASQVTKLPRAATSSSMSQKLRVKRQSGQTVWEMISPGKRRPQWG